MSKNRIPENLISLHAGEEAVSRSSLELISGDEDLLLHVLMIERVMDTLQFYRVSYDEETEEQLIVKLLGARLFNALGSAMKLLLSGYYQAAAMHIRDILETSFLLDYFSTDRQLIERWKAVPEDQRNKEFGPVVVRKALDQRDGFKEMKRAEHYKLLCKLAGHPTFEGLGMLRPAPGEDAHMGPFFVPALLVATIQELVKVGVLASGTFTHFFRPTTGEQFRASIHRLEFTSVWFKKVFGREHDAAGYESLKEMLREMEAEEQGGPGI
ncbi:hypothetical protein PZN02_001857 [Sinorhizobium garamanticum]|uniref:Uncharacterized protein n=1 Tax=Sinorhizobium garamanticum TaxID=680247 RepID=A0ABY8DEJ2_9HYPH|nr:hypothetical protein [Sinorhizobium garamanticum]WEX89294.1 hypothetical protein PZN02_001857 [Sinorhizobium garamanticum]